MVSMVGCIEPRGYPCTQDDQCVLSGVEGRCEATNFCSYPDRDCDSMYRYEARAGAGLAGRCVTAGGSETGGTTGSTDAMMSTGPVPDVGVPDACQDGSCGCAQELFSGAMSTWVRTTDDAVYCWGSNAVGQLGLGSTAMSFANPQPMMIPAGTEVVRFDAKNHACAALDDGSVYCWGANESGQSDWTQPQAPVLAPRAVEGLPFAPAVLAVGRDLSCAALGTDLRCWGAITGGAGPPRPPGEEFESLPGSVRHLALGHEHGCVVLDTEDIYCFGSDELGQWGDGSDTPSEGSAGVVQLPPHEAVLGLSAARNHTCALLQIGNSEQVLCWGDNSEGQSGGMEGTDPVLDPPRAVANLSPGDYVALAIADRHGCVVDGEGRLFCWGSNEFGMSDPWAQGWSFGAHEVTPPGEPLTATDVAAGVVHTCVQLGDRRVFCWGCNELLQLGPEHDANLCVSGQTLLGEVPLPCDGDR